MDMDPQQAALLIAQAQTSAAWWQAAAAFLQALLSFFAILAAVRIASGQRRDEARIRFEDKRALAKDLAMVYSRSFHAWYQRTKHLPEIAGKGDEGGVNIIALATGDVHFLQPPDPLNSLVGRLREFGPAAHDVQRAFIQAGRVLRERDRLVAAGLEVAAGRGNTKDIAFACELTTECCAAIAAADEAVSELIS